MKLIIKLLLGIIGGIGIGLLPYETPVRVLLTLERIFGQFIGFMIPFIILFFIATGISSLGTASRKFVGFTVIIAYVSTVLAGTLAYFTASSVIPFLSPSEGTASQGTGLTPYFSFEIEPIMGVITALVFAFVFGLGMTAVKSMTLTKIFHEGKEIIERTIVRVIIPFLPFYIAGIFAGLASEGTVFTTLQVFGIVLLVAIATHWIWLAIQYSTAGVVTKRNPLILLKTMLPAYFTALGTMSSAATIPVTLKQTKENKVKTAVADFVVPLCATIHLSGSVITIVSCSIAVMFISGGLAMPSFFTMLPVILALGVIMIAAPGVPGGAIMAAIGILTSMLGFTEVAVGLMIALYMAQDSFGTATNVTGDGAIALLIDNKIKES